MNSDNTGKNDLNSSPSLKLGCKGYCSPYNKSPNAFCERVNCRNKAPKLNIEQQHVSTKENVGLVIELGDEDYI